MRQNWPFPPTRPQAQPEPRLTLSRFKVFKARLNLFYTRFHILFIVFLCVVTALAGILIYDRVKPPPQRLTQRDIDAAVMRSLDKMPPKPAYASQVYGIVRPSVVTISAKVPGEGGKTQSALGAGVIVDDNGTVLTCLHVVRDATQIRIIFADGSESEATVVATQPENDLAVLRPEVIPDDLVPATLASSATLRVGDEVVAIGNPFGVTGSLSAGVVSGLGRNFKSPKTGETLTNLIQFDAAVNPGNSGGPLLDRNGEVVGIVAGLLNPTRQ
ncbi:MAG: trypsin-like peptidase domain-containing protein, partial [Dehalococcoidales bacterium]|nr:trypsin-like peptidase domain-containing protein [Dehalococcoidales bacterium]